MLERIPLLAVFLLVLLFLHACQASAPGAATTASPAPTPAEASSLPTEPAGIMVPAGVPPTIDGAMAPGEWESATVETFADGSELLLMQAQGSLYLGIRSNTPEMIVGNIFIDRGGEIAILHASAALGTALYRGGPEAWEQSQAFEWRCRRIGMGAAAVAEREAFFAEERWTAANAYMGTPNELEYRIEAPAGTLRLAVSFLGASDTNTKVPWPADLDDDCVLPTPGGLPVQLDFAPGRWATITLSP